MIIFTRLIEFGDWGRTTLKLTQDDEVNVDDSNIDGNKTFFHVYTFVVPMVILLREAFHLRSKVMKTCVWP